MTTAIWQGRQLLRKIKALIINIDYLLIAIN
jgi:hypothetical protein